MGGAPAGPGGRGTAATGGAGRAAAGAGSGPGPRRACGVCRTDLHLAEGDLPPKRPELTPGHEVVGTSTRSGRERPGSPGERVGVAWLGGTDGSCRFCRRGEENLCLRPVFTGWDVHGGYAESCLVAEHYAYVLPERSRTSRPRRCCAPGSSATGRCARPRCRPAGRWASTASAARPTSPPSSRCPRGCGCTYGPGAAATGTWRALWARTRPATRRPPPEPLDGGGHFAPVGELVPVAPARARPRRDARGGRHLPVRHPGR